MNLGAMHDDRCIRTLLRHLTLLLPLLVLAYGCASAPEPKKDFVPPVYPPPPAAPRFIYERTLLYNDDVEETTTAMRLRQFALGASTKLRGLVKPYDVAVHRGRVYVSDTVQRAVLVFDIPGKRLFQIGVEKPGELTKPLGITVATDGTLYVCDGSARRVMVYTGEGRFVRAIGGDQWLNRPSDVAVSTDGRQLFVVDTGGVDSPDHAIEVFSAEDGRHLETIGRRGTGPGEFNLPLQLAVSADGMVYVVDSGNFRVQAFNPDWSYAFSFGSVGRFPGQFARPKGIATDAEGRIYVIDTAFGNFQIFDRSGQLLMFIGERGQSGYPGMYMLPSGITVDEDGRIYVVDQFFRKIDIYRPVELSADQGYSASPLAKIGD